MRIKKHLWILLILCLPLFGDKVIDFRHQQDVPNPWFTGPLLAPSYVVVPLGSVNYEPYIEVIATTGFYNKHWKTQNLSHTFYQNTFQPFVQIGLGGGFDIEIAPVASYNYCDHQTCWVFEDFPLTVDVQLFAPKPMGDWRPYVKLSLTEIFPTGNYQKLDPRKKGTDIGGEGAYTTQVGIVAGKLFRLSKERFLNCRFFMEYSISSPVNLKGFNAHGGGYGTKAHFFLPQTMELDLGIELGLTQRWVLACDFAGNFGTKFHFSGNPGTKADGTPAILGNKASMQYTMAPALEYNWSDQLGIIGGGWFSVAGKNAQKFWSAVLAIDYYQ